MSDRLRVSFRGTTDFVATDREPRPLEAILDCPGGLAAGTDVRITISSFHSYTRNWELDGVRVETGNGRIVLGHGLPRDWTDMVRGGIGPAGGGLVGRPINEIYLCTVQVTGTLSAGAKLVFAFRAALSPHSAIKGSLLVKVRAPLSEIFETVGDAGKLSNSPGSAARLEVRCTASAPPDGKARAVIFATDELLNPVPDYSGEISLSADGDTVGLPQKLAIGPEGRGVVEGIVAGGRGPLRIQARDEAGGLAATSGPVRGADDEDGDRHFFGSIHFHTRLSVDGDREPREAYAYARDHLNLDVVAMADHAPIGPGWEECLQVNEEFYDPGRFVTLPAWESSNAYGHANLYLRTPDVDGGPGYWNPEVCPSEVSWDRDVVMVPHHPNCGQAIERGTHREVLGKGIYWSKYDWSAPNERARLVEVVQGRSSFEADALDDCWGIRSGGQGASVRDALAMGWRLGFVGGTDNHEGHPTQRTGEYVDMTCFRASELTREAIWQAMDRRQTYATSGVPIVADFSVNDVLSGSEAGLGKGEGVHFSALLHGTAPIEAVEIISGGECVWRCEPDEWDVELDGIELPPPEGEWAYYYLRLRQADGHRAWLSPVWLDR